MNIHRQYMELALKAIGAENQISRYIRTKENYDDESAAPKAEGITTSDHPTKPGWKVMKGSVSGVGGRGPTGVMNTPRRPSSPGRNTASIGRPATAAKPATSPSRPRPATAATVPQRAGGARPQVHSPVISSRSPTTIREHGDLQSAVNRGRGGMSGQQRFTPGRFAKQNSSTRTSLDEALVRARSKMAISRYGYDTTRYCSKDCSCKYEGENTDRYLRGFSSTDAEDCGHSTKNGWFTAGNNCPCGNPSKQKGESGHCKEAPTSHIPEYNAKKTEEHGNQAEPRRARKVSEKQHNNNLQSISEKDRRAPGGRDYHEKNRNLWNSLSTKEKYSLLVTGADELNNPGINDIIDKHTKAFPDYDESRMMRSLINLGMSKVRNNRGVLPGERKIKKKHGEVAPVKNEAAPAEAPKEKSRGEKLLESAPKKEKKFDPEAPKMGTQAGRRRHKPDLPGPAVKEPKAPRAKSEPKGEKPLSKKSLKRHKPDLPGPTPVEAAPAAQNAPVGKPAAKPGPKASKATGSEGIPRAMTGGHKQVPSGRVPGAVAPKTAAKNLDRPQKPLTPRNEAARIAKTLQRVGLGPNPSPKQIEKAKEGIHQERTANAEQEEAAKRQAHQQATQAPQKTANPNQNIHNTINQLKNETEGKFGTGQLWKRLGQDEKSHILNSVDTKSLNPNEKQILNNYKKGQVPQYGTNKTVDKLISMGLNNVVRHSRPSRTERFRRFLQDIHDAL